MNWHFSGCLFRHLNCSQCFRYFHHFQITWYINYNHHSIFTWQRNYCQQLNVNWHFNCFKFLNLPRRFLSVSSPHWNLCFHCFHFNWHFVYFHLLHIKFQLTFLNLRLSCFDFLHCFLPSHVKLHLRCFQQCHFNFIQCLQSNYNSYSTPQRELTLITFLYVLGQLFKSTKDTLPLW